MHGVTLTCSRLRSDAQNAQFPGLGLAIRHEEEAVTNMGRGKVTGDPCGRHVGQFNV